MNGIVIVCGLPGVGKTTFARWLAEDLDAAHLRTDVIRKEMFDEPTYSTAESEAVYDELLERGSELLQDGQAVVLDGTYRKQIQRYEVKELADDHGVPCLFYKVECDRDVVQQRLADRTDDASDADWEIHQRLTFDKLERPHLLVDNTPEEPDWTHPDLIEIEPTEGKPSDHIDVDDYHTLLADDRESDGTHEETGDA